LKVANPQVSEGRRTKGYRIAGGQTRAGAAAGPKPVNFQRGRNLDEQCDGLGETRKVGTQKKKQQLFASKESLWGGEDQWDSTDAGNYRHLAGAGRMQPKKRKLALMKVEKSETGF